jgi:hypothetical protein
MTQDEFYSKLMQDVEYIFKTGFKLSPEIFMQTMSYASEQYELLNLRIAELEAHIEAFQPKYDNGQLQYSKLWDMYSDLKKQLELATKDSK